MDRAILISIHPRWVELILSGDKTFEFRKSAPVEKVSHLVIYATAPVKMIVALAAVAGVVSGPPTCVWNRTRQGAGISREEFQSYFEGKKTAIAFSLESISKLNPQPLAAVAHGLTAPQSWRFLDKDIFDRVKMGKVEASGRAEVSANGSLSAPVPASARSRLGRDDDLFGRDDDLFWFGELLARG